MLKPANRHATVSLNPIIKLLRNISEKGFFHLLSANFFIGFLFFGSQLLVAKFLTPIELGQIKTMQSFISVGNILAGFGLSTAVLKLCSEKRSLQEKAFIFKQNMYYNIIPLLLVLAGFICLAKFEILSPDKSINKWLPFYMMVIPAMIYTSLSMAYLQALKEIQLMAKLQVFLRLLGFIIIVPVTYFYGLAGFVLSTVLIGYLSLIPLLNLVKACFAVKARVTAVFSQSIFYAKWSVSANAVSTFGHYLDIFMLNYLLKDRVNFGYYSLATIFILGLLYINSTVQSIATPYFSEKSDNKNEFLRVLKKYQKLMILFASVVSIVAFAVVPLFIKAVYGNNYAPAGFIFRILILKYFIFSCYALPGVAILGLGKMRYNFYSVSMSAVISFFLSYFFIKSYGITGAAVAQVISYFITFIIVSFMVRYVIKRHRFY